MLFLKNIKISTILATVIVITYSVVIPSQFIPQNLSVRGQINAVIPFAHATTTTKFVQLLDNTTGNALGWKPNGGISEFKILDKDVKANSIVTLTVNTVPQFGIKVGNWPTLISFNPTTNKIYVDNFQFGTVSVIDSLSNTVVSTIGSLSTPFGVAVNPKAFPEGRVYITESGLRMVSVIDSLSNTVVSTIQLGQKTPMPFGVAVNPNTNKIYVAKEHGVSVIDGITNKVSTNITTRGGFGVAVNPNTNKIYVGNIEGNTISVIDGKTNEVVQNIIVDQIPTGIAVNPNTNKIYVTNSGSNIISVIDGKTNIVLKTISVGTSSPYGIAVNPDTNKIYVANADGTVSVIDGGKNTLLATVGIRSILNIGKGLSIPFYRGVAVNPNTNRVYATNFGSGTVSVIDGSDNYLVPTNLVTCGVSIIADGQYFEIKCIGAPSSKTVLDYSVVTP